MMQTMFVDKKVRGANTVQTLSRLNRTMRGKDSTMVLDFENQPEEIREDFQHFMVEISLNKIIQLIQIACMTY